MSVPDTSAALREEWSAALAGQRVRIVFGDGEDPRVVEAAAMFAGSAVTPLLVGRRGAVEAAAGHPGRGIGHAEVLDPGELTGSGPHAAAIAASVRGRSDAADCVRDELYLAMAAVRLGTADGAVVGSTRPTGHVLRAALRVIGLAPGSRLLSSSFLMVLPDGRRLGFGDCAVVPDPDADQLAEIARATSATYGTLTGAAPVVAMLSFSTRGSADHPSVARVRTATVSLRDSAPGLVVDGELQFDAAVIESIGRAKAQGSPVAGRANVFVFPNLDAGNIGYKIAERLAGATALGPLLQGLAAPVNDLSRGCSAQDIHTVGLITARQALASRDQSRAARAPTGS
ncbi:MAG: phosphotransacetylase [Streptosporangiales bacterium]|nr:phosphotransacetylase [Streptosporangiales bacterium]